MFNYKKLMKKIDTFIFDVDGVLTDGTLSIFPDGGLIRKMCARDGYAIKLAKEKGYNICIITGGENLMVFQRLKNLGIQSIYLKSNNKIKTFNCYCNSEKISPEKVLYMGDDIPDIEVMQSVLFPCSPKDAVNEVKSISKYISSKEGGKGCVRDVIEQTMKIQEKWINNYNIISD